jgi:hypothetical protein
MVVLPMLTAIVVAFIAPPAKIGGIVASRPSAAVVAPVMIAGIKQPFVYEGTSSVNAWAPYDYRGTYRPYYPMAYNSYGNYGYGGNYYSPYSGRYGMGYGMGGYGGYGMGYGNNYSPYSYGRYGGGYGSPYSYGRYGGGYGRYTNYSPYSYGRYGMGYGMGGYGGYGMGYGNNYSPYSYGRYGGYGGYMSPRFDTASRMGLARQYSY